MTHIKIRRHIHLQLLVRQLIIRYGIRDVPKGHSKEYYYELYINDNKELSELNVKGYQNKANFITYRIRTKMRNGIVTEGLTKYFEKKNSQRSTVLFLIILSEL